MKTTIVRVMFTWSWEGFYIERADGSCETLSPTQLQRTVGEAEYVRLNRIAHRLPGHWQMVP